LIIKKTACTSFSCKQGTRRDLHEWAEYVIRSAKNSVSIPTIIETEPAHAMRYMRSLTAVHSMFTPRPDKRIPYVYCVAGSGGIGKSYNAYELFENDPDGFYVVPVRSSETDLLRFNGIPTNFVGTMLFEEVASYQFNCQTFNSLCDIRAYSARLFQADNVLIRPKRIIFTSNMSPLNWFPRGTPRHILLSCMRRFLDISTFMTTRAQCSAFYASCVAKERAMQERLAADGEFTWQTAENGAVMHGKAITVQNQCNGFNQRPV